MHHILVVDDDPTNAKLLNFLLRDQGYQVTTTSAPSQALKTLEEDEVDLIILESILPEMSGFDLCRLIRDQQHTPIIFLSTLTTVKDIVTGLQAGADDYLAKPYDPGELLARIWSLLRRSEQLTNGQSNLRNTDLILDPSKNEVTLLRTGQSIVLTPLEARLLRVLISSPGHTLTRDALVVKVWGYDYEKMSNQLDVYISRLRTKLEVDPSQPRLIVTVRAVGYRFDPTRPSLIPRQQSVRILTSHEQ
jgi:DNA-binding response OmpR family regulator